MWTFYLITRLDYIVFPMSVIGVISFMILVVEICLFIIEHRDFIDDNETMKKFGKLFKLTMATFLISSSISILVPSTKDAISMIAIDNIIDYTHSNQTAKELPDKAIKALDLLIEEYTKDYEKN